MQQFTDPSLDRLRAALVPFGVKLTVKKGGAKQTAHDLLDKGQVFPKLQRFKKGTAEGFLVEVASKSKPGELHSVWIDTAGKGWCDCKASPRCSHVYAARLCAGFGETED